MPRVKSVISLGVGGQTQGAWTVPAKALAYFGSTEVRAYTIAYGLAFMIESRFGTRSVYCPPDLDNEEGPRVPLQSLKLHAELAGIGARSLAGDILLHPEFGYLYFASVFTELALPPDQPLTENPCPAPSCFDLYKKIGKTPCMKFSPVQFAGTL
jgi:epoxyqueuosine reductase QueG